MIHKHIALLLSSILSCSLAATPRMMQGSIAFPSSISKIPQIRVYCSGIIAQTEIDPSSKKLHYTFAADNTQQQFYVLVTDEIYPVTHKSISTKKRQNTISGLRVPENTEYRLYFVEHVPKFTLTPSNTQLLLSNARSTTKQKNTVTQTIEYVWSIKEMQLSLERIIPDNTVIIRLPASYIDRMDLHASVFELPSLLIKPDILALLGSEEKLQTVTNALLIDSMNLDAIHSTQRICTHIDQNHPRTLVLPTT